MAYIDADVLKRSIRVNLMPNVDVDGTVTVENATRYFLNLIDKTTKADVAEVKWIPVTERLPKCRRDYLCICVFGESKMQFCDVLMFHPEQNAENGYVTGPHFSNEGMEGMRVTHWMPLPKPPCGTKMDGKDGAE